MTTVPAGRAAGNEPIEIFGCRVDPEQVEAALTRHPAVTEAVVTARRHASGQQELVAHVAVPGGATTAEQLRHHATALLPEHMVPRTVVVLPALPRTADGRLDPGAPADGPSRSSGPRGPLELALCELFGSLLETGTVAPDDDFFELGGHSMLAVRLASRARAVLGRQFAVRDVFDAPTPRLLAELLAAGDPSSHTEPCLALRAGDGGPPLFCVHPVLGLSWSYAALLPHLDQRVPVHGLQATGLPTGAQAPGTLDAVADAYVRLIREVRPDGPYHLAGWSLGGVLAHAAAVRLRQQGERVATLALIDAYPLTRRPGEEAEATRRRVLAAILASVGHPEEEATVLGGTTAVDAAVRDRLGLDEAPGLVETACHVAELAHDHTPGRFDGELLFFEADEDRPEAPRPDLWGAHTTDRVRLQRVPGDHFAMMRSPATDAIGAALTAHLRATGRIT
ncbi:alpha/beta fold hydrolase [Streptomyces sp. DSM 44915]|uniref:Alpha/beta fold hydrolase n=1 Tax=Streptomyces chisholmiae TaxID=3075540 RepID=A0ABU2JNK8_9ACTN|nr:alpha/beta fold hydrolase [Streptomyces sp. DSM 44915]MDT0266089.1 alpha/beta fold hydrolase [Streptomyces sp. DSM 44915]